jgi:hypothetical protein
LTGYDGRLPDGFAFGGAGEPRITVYRVRLASFEMATNADKRAAALINWHGAALLNIYGHQTLEARAKLIAENIRRAAHGETPLNLVAE